MADDTTDESIKQLTDEQKDQIARREFGRQLHNDGCILDRERIDNWYRYDTAIQSAIQVHGEKSKDVHGVRKVVSKMKRDYPELFRRSGDPLPGGTPPRREDLSLTSGRDHQSAALVTGATRQPKSESDRIRGMPDQMHSGGSPAKSISSPTNPGSLHDSLARNRKRM